MYLMTLTSQPVIHSIDSLDPKTMLGGILGLKILYQNTPITPFAIEVVDNDIQNIEKLKLGRIGEILGVIPDFNKYLDQLHFDSKLV